jgi:uncharacterized SAM-binding protein YcdF (DUF218 family)
MAIMAMGLASWKPLPQAIIRPLEERFPVWNGTPTGVAGIVILGGALEPELSRWPGSGLSNSTGRITEGVFLARRFPHAKVIYLGGGETISEAEQARVLLNRLGIEPERVIVETRSRTTAENAKFSCGLVAHSPAETWLLVTSASHMPRAVGAFRAVGFDVVPYPVDYRAVPTSTWFDLGSGLELVRIALKEYIGLVAYRIAGRTLELFPGPSTLAPVVSTGRCDDHPARLVNQLPASGPIF